MEESKKKAILHAISLSEMDINIILLLLAAVTQNLYILSIFGVLFCKHIPEQILKRTSEHFGWEIGKRPSDAENCNSINSGGPAHNSGLVSGHVFNITSLTFFLLYSFTQDGRTMSSNEITLISFMFVLIAALGYARVELHCHTKQQVAIGFTLGIIWGYVMLLILNYLTSVSTRLKDDRDKLFK